MIDVDMAQLSLAQQLMQRQSEHADAIGKHLDQFARMTASELGLILMLFKPIGDAIVDAGIGATELSHNASALGAERMGQTVEAYQDAERQVHELLSQVNQMLTGHKLPPYKAPTMPTLGGALDSAPSRYGEPDGNVFNQAFWDGYSAAEWADETGGRIGDRVRSGVSASREVVETSDARSYLPRRQGEDPEIESIRWSAGPIFGGVDWIWEELFGYSLIEEITKPFVGDWERMREASQAWTHAGDALTAISQNYMGLLPPLAVWQGKGSEIFLAAAGVVSQAHKQLTVIVRAIGQFPVNGKVVVRTPGGAEHTVTLRRGTATFTAPWVYAGKRTYYLEYLGSRNVRAGKVIREIVVR